MSNPWQKQGVSIIPSDLGKMLPIVGQRDLFKDLSDFRDSCFSEDPTDRLAGFFVIHGGWGVGKSRIGHELCLEAVSEDVEWIVEGEADRIFKSSFQDGVLPLFVRYSQVSEGENSEDLNRENWIPTVTVEALTRLVNHTDKDGKGSFERNQERILTHTIQALKPKGWDAIRGDLAEALKDPDVGAATHKAIEILKTKGIKSLWIIVDEIEDITDVDTDGLASSERKSVDQALIGVIPRVAKNEEERMAFPQLNFVLLCSLAVGDLIREVGAIKRRTTRYELRTNAFTDVEQFFAFLENNRPSVWEQIKDYPPALKEAAFFAANRNFGWFNLIMHHAHENRQGVKAAFEMIRRFSETKHGEDIFDSEAIGSYHIDQDDDKGLIEQFMYGLLPRRVGEGISEPDAERLLNRRDAAESSLFTKVIETKSPEPHRITAQFVKSGFRTEPGSILVLPGESRFDLKVVMDSLRSYSNVSLGKDRREHLLIPPQLSEFNAQLRSLSPYADKVEYFAEILHGLLTDPDLLVEEDGKPTTYLAPAFTFLSGFHRLNRVKSADEGYLTESSKNTKLEEQFRAVQKAPADWAQALLKGTANAIERDRAPVLVGTVPGCQLPALTFQSELENFNLGPDGSSVILYGAKAKFEDIEGDLNKIASKCPGHPVLLILEEEDEREKELRDRLPRNVQKMAPRVIILNLSKFLSGTLVRLGMLGDAFDVNDLKTSQFNAAIERAREVLKDAADQWRNGENGLEKQGLVLAPVFYGARVSDEQLEAFAKGYAAMLGGMSYHDVSQTGSGVLNEKERIEFTKLAERQFDPNVKFKDQPLLRLIAKPEAEEIAEVPRALLSLIGHSKIGKRPATIEKEFFFDLPDPKTGVSVKRKDVVYQTVRILVHLGLVEEEEGDQIRQASVSSLKKRIEAAQNWLDGRFETAANKIKAIHQDEGDRLINAKGKEAKQALKEAEKRVEKLSLDFIGKPWKELNREIDGDTKFYEFNLTESLKLITRIRTVLSGIYDSEKERGFAYSPEVLPEFQAEKGGASYPLWKRLKILEGFYKEIGDRRRDLQQRIEEVREDIDKRAPRLENGEKSFPTQALSLPLDLMKAELGFDADHPNKTIAIGSSTLGAKSLGFKLYDEKYEEARERIEHLEAELTQPGKLVSNFIEALNRWENLKKESGRLRSSMERVTAFFSDAPDNVKAEANLSALTQKWDDLDDGVNRGGICQNVDEADAAGARAEELIPILEEDLNQLNNIPDEIGTKVSELETNVNSSLEIEFQREHADLIRAAANLRSLADAEGISWPREAENTYGATKVKFEALVESLQKEGETFFADTAGTTFEDYQQLLKMQVQGKTIDWNSDEYRTHMNNLMDKKLLKLLLVT
ncbi:MAG: hypothetical protein MI807_17900 [Verrucomicrobiales bacterium]|nr:hypothetical protein [Verrucomicrobiales bacterium]